MTDTIATQLADLADRDEITHLVYRLGVALDEGRFDDLRSLFTPEGSASTPGGTAEGIDSVVAQAARNHPPDMSIQHVTTNILVDVDDPRRRATVRANLIVTFAPGRPGGAAGGPPIVPAARYTLGEIYRFEAVRTADGWRLSRVETTPVWSIGERPVPPVPQPTPADTP